MTSSTIKGTVHGMDAATKVRENRLRQKAGRQGLTLKKSGRRDEDAIDYGTYMLVDRDGKIVAATLPDGYGLTLDEIEDALTSRKWRA